MALVKRTALGKRPPSASRATPVADAAAAPKPPQKPKRAPKRQTAAERIAAATQQLASGVAQ